MSYSKYKMIAKESVFEYTMPRKDLVELRHSIDYYVNQKPDLFIPITIAFLTVNIQNYKKVMNDPEHRSKRTIALSKIVYEHKKSTIKRLKTVPMSKYRNEDWAQIISVIYQIYVFHDPKKPSVYVRFFGRRLSNDVISAHLQFCCRQYLYILPYDKRREGLNTLKAIIKQIDDAGDSLKRLHSLLI